MEENSTNRVDVKELRHRKKASNPRMQVINLEHTSLEDSSLAFRYQSYQTEN